MNKERCLIGKRKYETQNEAINVAAYQMSKGGAQMLRTYECHVCHKWHITSQSFNESRRKKRKRTQ